MRESLFLGSANGFECFFLAEIVKNFGGGVDAFAEEALFDSVVGGYRRLSALGGRKDGGEVGGGS